MLDLNYLRIKNCLEKGSDRLFPREYCGRLHEVRERHIVRGRCAFSVQMNEDTETGKGSDAGIKKHFLYDNKILLRIGSEYNKIFQL